MCIVSSCQVTGNAYYGIVAVGATPNGGVELVPVLLGPKHTARPTCCVNVEYANALWLRCTEDALRDVVRSINPDKFNMSAGTDAAESTEGRKRKSPPAVCVPDPDKAQIVLLQSELETLRKEIKRLTKTLERRDTTIIEKESIVAENKKEITQLKKDLKTAQNAKKPKSAPRECTKCAMRAREETTPENRKSSKQQPQPQSADIVQVLVSERDKNDKLVMDLTSQMTDTLVKVVADVVKAK